jgi:rhamnose transport system substrate-binding protein
MKGRAIVASGLVLSLVATLGIPSTRPGVAHAAALGAGSGCTIQYIPKNTGNPYFDTIINGFKSTVGKVGYSFAMSAPSSAGGTLQIPYINTAVAQHVCAIAISPNDPDAVVPALKQAMTRGIKVLAVNSDMNPAGRQAAILPAPFPSIGAAQIGLIGKLIGYKGEIAILSATTTAPDQNFWIVGMKQALTMRKYAGMKLVKVAYGNDDPATSTSQTEALLAAYPNLRGIVSPTTVGVAAAAKVIQDKHLAHKIAVTGLGDPNEMRSYVLNNTVTAFQLWDPAKEGIMATYLFHAMIANKFMPKPGATFNAGPLGKITINKQGQMIASPLVTFDKSNISQYHF